VLLTTSATALALIRRRIRQHKKFNRSWKASVVVSALFVGGVSALVVLITDFAVWYSA